jgi:DNA polymerase III epsilon subunit-like protein
MKKILFYDTETSGIPPARGRRYENLDNYPWLLQISAILYTEDSTELRHINHYVRRPGLGINNSNIHGITPEVLAEKGEDIDYVIQKFKEICAEADLVVCHNYAFDSTIVRTELKRNGIRDFLSEIPFFCTMTECGWPSASISLQKLHTELFGKKFDNHHDSLSDTRATANCFFKMIEKGWLENKNGSYHFNRKPQPFEFDLDPENKKFYNAFSIITESKKNIFLTGKAGTGKTTFLKYLRQRISKFNITLAYTGVAAINAGGQTINSFFQLDFRPFLPGDNSLSKQNIYSFLKYSANKREIINKLEVIIIDEISMVKADTIDAIDRILRVYRKKESLPFGGVQMIFIGDLFQLPPIEGDGWNAVAAFYKSPYFFDSEIIGQLNDSKNLVFIELDKVYRQTETEFIEILNKIRIGEHETEDLDKLNRNKFDAAKLNELLADNYVVLTTTNNKVDTINEKKLKEIDSPEFSFTGFTEGEFPEHMKTAPQYLTLKAGAQVMLLKNTGRNYNGKIGRVVTLQEGKVEVFFEGDKAPVQIDRVEWENTEYTYNKEKHLIDQQVKGRYIQFPLKLAWAVTVHKSQGQTFNKVIADVSGAFSVGQVYVALSRCTSLGRLKLVGTLQDEAIKVDRRVVIFSKNQTPDSLITNFINESKIEVLYHCLRALQFDESIEEVFNYLQLAVKFENDLFSSDFMIILQEFIDKYKIYQYSVRNLGNASANSSNENSLDKNYLNKLEEAIIPIRDRLKSTMEDLKVFKEDFSDFLAGKPEINKKLVVSIDAFTSKYMEFDEIEKELRNLKARWFG